MLSSLLSAEVQSFIENHQNDEPAAMLLKYNSIFGIPTSIIVDQVVGRRKAKEKLPTWYNTKLMLYPPAINIEQCSSERAAELKVRKFLQASGHDFNCHHVLDLTGGFGVDSYFFSHVFNRVSFVEPNTRLTEIVKQNFFQLDVSNIDYHNTTAEEFLKSLPVKNYYDLIYIDPSRRSTNNQKLFSFDQCEPDVPRLFPKFFQMSNDVLVKASPLLDITLGLREIQNVKKVLVTSIDNECKELLFYCKKGYNDEPLVEAINLNSAEDSLSFFLSDERKIGIEYGDPLTFLYEPYASILKSGAFKTVASKFRCRKLQPSTHLCTSHDLVENFPGRIFRIEAFVKPDPKVVKPFFDRGRGNIIVRNYPLTVEALRKKTGLQEGGENFLIACTGMNKKFLMVASRIK